jgi:hypothetical protein
MDCIDGYPPYTVSAWTSTNESVVSVAEWAAEFTTTTLPTSGIPLEIPFTQGAYKTIGTTQFAITLTDSHGHTQIIMIPLTVSLPIPVSHTGASLAYGMMTSTWGPYVITCQGGYPPYTTSATSSNQTVISNSKLNTTSVLSPSTFNVTYGMPDAIGRTNITTQCMDSQGNSSDIVFPFQVTFIHRLQHDVIVFL